MNQIPSQSHLFMAEMYAQHIVDNMSVEDLMIYVQENLENEFVLNYTEQQLSEEIKDLAPELFED